ncbi:hypothetical protein Bca52824_055379 [Brassica carinata]|uniref:Uncharacterized protein n=1 Tax=Brassica carinata TaxID=52824 RepID=A0A8X7UMR8_BRACI|nr:hypothetical protein Bca52824_055379 [Brassica carinata]
MQRHGGDGGEQQRRHSSSANNEKKTIRSLVAPLLAPYHRIGSDPRFGKSQLDLTIRNDTVHRKLIVSSHNLYAWERICLNSNPERYRRNWVEIIGSSHGISPCEGALFFVDVRLMSTRIASPHPQRRGPLSVRSVTKTREWVLAFDFKTEEEFREMLLPGEAEDCAHSYRNQWASLCVVNCCYELTGLRRRLHLGGRWSFIFIGLIGVVVVGRVIFCCWKGRQQTTQQVTPVGDIEMVAAAP